MRPIVWLASYPKCGNTWLRLLLTNLQRDTAVSINDLGNAGGTASARARFDDTFLFAAGLLRHHECDRLRPTLYRHIASQSDANDDGNDHRDEGDWQAALKALRFVKTHDAWTRTDRGEPLLGGRAAATAAILIVRDPRDVAASLANHNGQTLDAAITLMADKASALASAEDRQSHHLRQMLLGWSGFCGSWLDQREIPVHVLRFEDIEADPPGTLGALLASLGIAIDAPSLAEAAVRSDFRAVQAEEAQIGFREAPVRMATGRFFRQGRSGGWRSELTAEQCRRIEANHGEMMGRFGYLPSTQ